MDIYNEMLESDPLNPVRVIKPLYLLLPTFPLATAHMVCACVSVFVPVHHTHTHHQAVLKRKIAVYVGRNDTQLAITNLNKYLELYVPT